MRRLIALASALLLVVAACGGDTGDAGTADQGDQAQTTQPDATQPDVPDVDDSEGSGPSTATVTIGDQTYNFSSEGTAGAQCRTDLYGIFLIQLTMIDDSGAAQADGRVKIAILREGTDPDVVGQVNEVRVDAGDDTWKADPTAVWYLSDGAVQPEGKSQVDSVEIDGRTVRGTATFSRETFSQDTGLGLETMTGTFEGTCGEERLS